MSKLAIFFHAKELTPKWLSNFQAWTRQCNDEIEFYCLVPASEKLALSKAAVSIPRLTILSSDLENLGRAFSQACSQSKADWLTFLDARLPLCNFGSTQLLTDLKGVKHQDAFLVAQRYNRKAKKWKQLPHVDPTEDAPLLFSREALVELGGFNEGCRFRPLYDLVLRAIRSGKSWKRLEVELAGSPGPLNRSCESLQEGLRISQSHYGRVSSRWALRCSRESASVAGLGQLTSAGYSQHVLRHAEAFYDGSNQLNSAKLRFFHTLSSVKAILKSPPTALRYFDSKVPDLRSKISGSRQKFSQRRSNIPPWNDYFSTRIFQLGYHEAIPCRLPATYASSQRPRSSSLPSITITTPNLNQGSTIERSILSVLSQNYPGLEYTIQDGGSKDESNSVIRCYEDHLSRNLSQPDRGQTEAIGHGFMNTNGDIMAYLNSDDVLLPGALQFVGEYFAKNPKVDVLYGDRVLIDSWDREINRWYLPAYDDQAILWADYIPQETLFWRRRAWEAVGGLDTSFQFAMDWDLILRFRRAGMRFVHVPRLLGAFRISDNQKTSAHLASTGFREMCRLRERELGFVPTQEEVWAQIRGFVRKHQRISGWRFLQRHWTPTEDWTKSVASQYSQFRALSDKRYWQKAG